MKETLIQRRAPLVALVVLVGLAIKKDLTPFFDVLVDKSTFLTDRSFEAPAQEHFPSQENSTVQ